MDGTLLAVREDIGRHNAVDKLVGWALIHGAAGAALIQGPAVAGPTALGDTVLVVSGRLGYEIVQKAIAAGIPIVASVGAASSLAVELAEGFGLTLATFLRPGSGNLFGKTARVRLSAPARQPVLDRRDATVTVAAQSAIDETVDESGRRQSGLPQARVHRDRVKPGRVLISLTYSLPVRARKETRAMPLPPMAAVP